MKSFMSIWKFIGLLSLLLIARGTVAEDTCLSCHDGEKAVSGIMHRAHGQAGDSRAPMGTDGCATCHGASTEHTDKPKKFKTDRSFGSSSMLSSSEQNEVCLDCHRSGNQKAWLLSEHSAADVTCVSCHSMHAVDDPVQSRLPQSKVCIGCHADQRVNQTKFSRHPVKEGIVACSDCHDTHGGKGPSMLVESSVNETCYLCHAEKRGPLLFEHEPVQDDCTNCHTPHGSVNDNMLVIRPPLLCQQCHIASRHPGTNYISESELASNDSRLIGKSCLNCHGQVHGSNHPAGFSFRR